MTHENTPYRPERHAPVPAMDGAAGRRPDRSRCAAPRTAVVLLGAVLGAALGAVPAYAWWDDIYGNSAHFIGPSVEFESLGYWNVTEGDSVTVRFGKYNNLLMDSNMAFSTRECKTCTINKAVAGTDFNTATGSASFPGNGHPRVSSDFTIRTIENNKIDGKRCFYIDIDWNGKVNYTNFLNWLVKHTKSGRQTHVMCILDDDNVPTTSPQKVGVSIDNASVEEGGAMTFTVSAPVAAGGAFTVQPAFSHATTESGDFTANTPELAFAGTGAESKTFTVQTTEDTAIEGTESFDVALTLVSKSFTGTIGLGKGRGTIRDDDYPELTISDASAVEGGSLRFTLTLDDAIPPGYSTFYVQPAITAGTATANSDYVAAKPALVRFAGTKGETKTVSVTTLADTVRNEPDETLTLSASGVSSAPVITTDTGTGTIRERTYTDANKPALSVTGGGERQRGQLGELDGDPEQGHQRPLHGDAGLHRHRHQDVGLPGDRRLAAELCRHRERGQDDHHRRPEGRQERERRDRAARPHGRPPGPGGRHRDRQRDHQKRRRAGWGRHWLEALLRDDGRFRHRGRRRRNNRLPLV